MIKIVIAIAVALVVASFAALGWEIYVIHLGPGQPFSGKPEAIK